MPEPPLRSKTVLEVEDVHTYYGESHVLQGISLHVAGGEVLAILGRNGMGKTTLIRSIIGFTPPRRGAVRARSCSSGKAPTGRSMAKRAGVSACTASRQFSSTVRSGKILVI